MGESSGYLEHQYEYIKRLSVKNLHWETDLDDDDYVVTEISGDVRGSSRNFYRVSLSVDEEYSEIIDSYCECPAYESHVGICKHCVALALQYIQIRDAGHAGLFSGEAKKKARGVKITDPELGKLLKRYAAKTRVSYTQPEVFEKVKLEPILSNDQGNLSLEFRIGIQKMYVLKNIGKLVQAVQNFEEVSYGKHLQFLHHMELHSTAQIRGNDRHGCSQPYLTDP